MKMAFILFDGMTSLDLTGFTEAITWLGILNAVENVSWDFCGIKEEVIDDRGMTIKINNVCGYLSQYDLIFVPGGMTTRPFRNDEEFLLWLQKAKDVKYKVSVCSGALLLGESGFSRGKQATTNPSTYELLAPYCSEE